MKSKHIKIPEAQMRSLVAYLQKKPYEEVGAFLQMVSHLPFEEYPEPKKDTKKKDKKKDKKRDNLKEVPEDKTG